VFFRKDRKQLRQEIYKALELFVSYVNQEIAEDSNSTISKLVVMRPLTQLEEGSAVFHIFIVVYFNKQWVDSVLKYFNRGVSDDFNDEYLMGRVPLEDLDKISKFEEDVNSFVAHLDSELDHFEEELEMDVFAGLKISWKIDPIDNFIQSVQLGQIWHRNVNGDIWYYTPWFIDKDGGEIVLIGTRDLDDMKKQLASGQRHFSFEDPLVRPFVLDTSIKKIKNSYGSGYFNDTDTRYTLQNMKLI